MIDDSDDDDDNDDDNNDNNDDDDDSNNNNDDDDDYDYDFSVNIYLIGEDNMKILEDAGNCSIKKRQYLQCVVLIIVSHSWTQQPPNFL